MYLKYRLRHLIRYKLYDICADLLPNILSLLSMFVIFLGDIQTKVQNLEISIN